MTMLRTSLALIILVAFLLPFTAHGQEFTIKFATIAPEGSTWMNVMKEYDQTIRKESNGRLGFKIYAGGVSGDEKDALRKIKLGQLHSAGITGVGMTTIAPKLRILDAPFLISSADEADYVTNAFDAEFSKAFEEGGYVNLGWAEVGLVYIYTNTPVQKPADLSNVKMWMWEGDPIAESAFKAMGISPISLSITDVMTSLQTKLIDGVYTSPYACIALQWFTRVKYMLKAPLANASGAVVIAKKKFDELPPDLQQILLRNGKQYMRKLTLLSREENTKSMDILKKNGVTFIDPPSKEALREYEEIGKRARKSLTGKLFTEEFLQGVEGKVAEFKASHGTKSK